MRHAIARNRVKIVLVAVTALLLTVIGALGLGTGGAGAKPAPPTPVGSDGSKMVLDWHYHAEMTSTQALACASTPGYCSISFAALDPSEAPAVPAGDRWVVEMVSVSAIAHFGVDGGAVLPSFALADQSGPGSPQLLVLPEIRQQSQPGPGFVDWEGSVVGTHLYIDHPATGNVTAEVRWVLNASNLSTGPGNTYFDLSLFGYLVPLTV